jgi:PilZ domain
MRQFAYRKPRMATGFQIEFEVEHSHFPGFCRDVSDEGLRAEFHDLLVKGTRGLLILRPRTGVLALRSQVAYVEKRQVGLLFLFETPWERRMTVEFIAAILNDTGHPPLIPLP